MLLNGLGNGLLTIVRGTLPLELFGPGGYGARQGWVALPGRVVGAVSPFVLGWVLLDETQPQLSGGAVGGVGVRGGHGVVAALCLTASLSTLAFLLLLGLRPRGGQER